MDSEADPALRDAAATGDVAELAMCMWSPAGLNVDATYGPDSHGR
jgi:hypothetical protein